MPIFRPGLAIHEHEDLPALACHAGVVEPTLADGLGAWYVGLPHVCRERAEPLLPDPTVPLLPLPRPARERADRELLPPNSRLRFAWFVLLTGARRWETTPGRGGRTCGDCRGASPALSSRTPHAGSPAEVRARASPGKAPHPKPRGTPEGRDRRELHPPNMRVRFA